MGRRMIYHWQNMTLITSCKSFEKRVYIRSLLRCKLHVCRSEQSCEGNVNCLQNPRRHREWRPKTFRRSFLQTLVC